MAWYIDIEMALVDYKGQMLTVAQVKKQLELAELSNSALQAKLKKVQRVSRSRLERMRNRGKLLIQTRAALIRLQDEAHGG